MQPVFEKIDKKYKLGIIEEPVALNGGFMHRMYRLNTKQKKYAVKLLNPYVMKRDTAMAKQEINGEYFYLFEYYPGKALSGNDITEYHCTEIVQGKIFRAFLRFVIMIWIVKTFCGMEKIIAL